MESNRLDMRRIMPGLHAGDMIRAERKNDGHWAFDMKMRRISEKDRGGSSPTTMVLGKASDPGPLSKEEGRRPNA